MMACEVTLVREEGQRVVQVAFEDQTWNWPICFPPVRHGCNQPSDSITAAGTLGCGVFCEPGKRSHNSVSRSADIEQASGLADLATRWAVRGPESFSLHAVMFRMSNFALHCPPPGHEIAAAVPAITSRHSCVLRWKDFGGSSGAREALSGAAQHTSSKDQNCQHLN